MTDRPRLGVVMDPIGAIKYKKDSTLAMLLAAQTRGFELAAQPSLRVLHDALADLLLVRGAGAELGEVLKSEGDF